MTVTSGAAVSSSHPPHPPPSSSLVRCLESSECLSWVPSRRWGGCRLEGGGGSQAVLAWGRLRAASNPPAPLLSLAGCCSPGRLHGRCPGRPGCRLSCDGCRAGGGPRRGYRVHADGSGAAHRPGLPRGHDGRFLPVCVHRRRGPHVRCIIGSQLGSAVRAGLLVQIGGGRGPEGSGSGHVWEGEAQRGPVREGCRMAAASGAGKPGTVQDGNPRPPPAVASALSINTA